MMGYKNHNQELIGQSPNPQITQHKSKSGRI